MEPHDYIIDDIRGDYAMLLRLDDESDEPFQVALALLPPGSDIGTKLSGFMGCFEIVEEVQ